MYSKVKPVFETNSGLDHPEAQAVNTRVSEYLRKYGQGKIDELPKDSRPVVNDDREASDMLDDDFVDGIGTDELDVLAQLDNMKERISVAQADLKATERQKEMFENACKVLNDPNSSTSERVHAMNTLDDLEKKGKITYARES